MPTVVTESPYRPVPLDPPRKRWTRAECAALEATGVWDQQKLELVEGELINKMGKSRPHVTTHAVLFGWLLKAFGNGRVNSEAPIDVSPEDNPTSEPQPDLIVLSKPTREIVVNPQPSELLLAIEISDSSLGFDLTTKASLYARAGIADYWVVDIAAKRIVVHREPREGAYHSITMYAEHESVSPLAAPGSALAVSECFS